MAGRMTSAITIPTNWSAEQWQRWLDRSTPMRKDYERNARDLIVRKYLATSVRSIDYQTSVRDSVLSEQSQHQLRRLLSRRV